MSSRKNIVALAILLCLTTLFASANIGPNSILPKITPVLAATCPTGGSGNPCFVVQLNARSSPVPTAGQTCAAQTSIPSQLPACDVAIRPTSSNATTFRVGAVVNASTAGGGLGGVFGWQFALNYNTTLVTAIADPSTKIPAGLVAPFCSAYPECAEKTVWFGSQLTVGAANWAGAIQGGTGATAITLTEDPVTHAGKIFVAFTFLAPASPVTLTARTVLANVAFAIVKGGGVTPPVATITLSDVLFSTQAGTAIPGIQGSSPTVCRLTPSTAQECGFVQVTLPNSPPTVSFTSVTHTGTAYTFNAAASDSDDAITSYTWDFGDKTALVTTAGGATSTVSHDYGINGARSGPGRYNVTVRVIDAPTQCATAANCYTPGATGAARDSSGLAIVNVQPSHQFSNLGLVEIGPQPSFTFNPASPTAGSPVTFNATSSRYPDEPILKNATPAAGTALTGTAGGDATCTPTLFAPCPVGFVDNNANAKFDPGIDTIVRAEDGATTCNAAPAGPCIILAGPTITPAGQPIIVDGKIAWADTNLDGIIDPTETIVYDQNSNLIYDGIKTYTWDFGDPASGTSNTATGITATHTFNPTATTIFTVKLTVTDNIGGTASVNNPVTVTAVQAKHNTTTTVSCAPSTIVINEGSTCTATVTDSTSPVSAPTGTVTLSVSGVTGTFTTCTLAAGTTAGVATCNSTFTASTTGTASITGTYPGDTNHNASPTSVATSVTVNVRTTTTGVTCTSPVVINQGSTCTVTVTDSSTAGTAITPTGSLTLSSTGATGTFTTCSLAAGTTAATATCTSTFTPSASGSANIVGTYAGDSSHSGSSNTATPAIVTVNKRTTTTSLTCTSPVVVNQGSTCTATVTDASTAGTVVTPIGTVTFTPTGVTGIFTTCTLATTATAGTATCTSTFTASTAGTATINGSYSGDSTHATSSTNTAASVTVILRTTSTTVNCSPTGIPAGQSSTCTATVTDTTTAGTAVTPGGTVAFSQTGIATGTSFTGSPCTLVAATAGTATCQVTFSSTNTGTATISATYASTDTAHTGSSTTTSATVIVGGHVTTTSVTCTSPVVVNQGSTCTATVTDTSTTGATTPTGIVTFNVAGITGTFTTCTLIAGTTTGTATCNSTFMASTAGSASIVGTYSGDSSHSGSNNNAAPASVTVNKRATSTAVTCTPSTIDVGQSTLCTATVSDTDTGTASTPSGTVTFSPSASCALAGTGSQASCSATEASTPFPPSLFVSATYGGDSTHSASGPSAAFTVTVQPRTTSTTVNCSPSSVALGGSTLCTATVKDTDTGTSSTPTGTVTITSSGSGTIATSPCTLSGTGTTATCQVTITPSGTPPRTDTITGTYSGDATHATSTNMFSLQVTAVALHSTTTTVACLPMTIVAGQATLCTATVTDTSATPTTPTGTVDFTTSGLVTFSPSGTCILAGTGSSATCSTSVTPLFPGPLTVAGGYSGDIAHSTSVSGTNSPAVTVNKRTTATTVNCSPSSITTGQTSNCIVTVTDSSLGTTSTPTGTVDFTTSGTGTFATSPCTLAAGTTTGTASCFVIYTPAGSTSRTDTITASYNGDSTHSTSSQTFDLGVSVPTKHVTSTTVSCTPSPVLIGQATSCTATVTDTSATGATTPTGTVAFTPTATCALAGTGSSASCSTNITPTTAGTLAVSAVYNGDATHNTSNGSTSVTVNVHSSSITINCTPTSVVVNQPVNCTATVTDPTTGNVITPTGSVNFTPNGGCTLAAGTCSASVTPTATGSLSVSASYAGDASHSGSTSNTVTITVSTRTTSTGITCVPSPIIVGSATTCTVTATDTSTAGAPGINPTGTVTITSSGTGTFTGSPCTLAPITTPPIPIGTSTCQITFTPSGTAPRTDTISANYGGDAIHSGSSGAFQLSIIQVALTGGHAKLIGYRAAPQFRIENLQLNVTQTLFALGKNDGNIAVNVYVLFTVTTPSGTSTTLYTQVVQLSPGQVINGRNDTRFSVQFQPVPGTCTVTATIYYSPSSSTIGDPSFKPDTASAKTFSFNALGVKTHDFNFEDDITSTSQSFDASIQNKANIDLVSRIDVTIHQPDGTTTSYVSDGQLLHRGQNGDITFIVPLTGPDGTYCFTATVKFGIDTNHNGQLDNNEILGTSGRQHDCFFADTDDAPAGTVIASPMTITRLTTEDDD